MPEKAPEKAERKEEILWMRPDSVTYKIDLGGDSYQVCKVYSPAQIEKAHKGLNPGRSSNLVSGPNQLDTQISLYRREVRLLRTLQDVGTGLVPQLCGEDQDNLEVYMEYLPYPTYQQKLLQASQDKDINRAEETRRRLVGELVDILQKVHSICDENYSHILRKVNEDKNILRVRSIEEQTQRIEKHLLLIAYTCGRYSPELRGKVSHTLNSRAARAVIRETLQQKCFINTSDLAKKFIQRDNKLQENALLSSQKNYFFVHGDFGPQNIFYTKEDSKGDYKGEENIKICDFDKTRLGSPNDDLANLLYNTHMLPLTPNRIAFLEEQAKIYFTDRDIRSPELTAQRQALVSSTLGGLIRFFGVYCKMDWQEIAFFNGLNPSVPDAEGSKQRYLQDRFVDSLHLYIDHNLTRYDSGTDKSGSLLQQLRSAKKILYTLGLVSSGGP